MPVSRIITLVGSAGFSFASINSAGLTKKTCDNNELASAQDKAAVPAGSRAWHAVFGLGVGAEFGLGL